MDLPPSMMESIILLPFYLLWYGAITAACVLGLVAVVQCSHDMFANEEWSKHSRNDPYRIIDV